MVFVNLHLNSGFTTSLAVCPEANYSTSLDLFICKTGVIIAQDLSEILRTQLSRESIYLPPPQKALSLFLPGRSQLQFSL